MAGVKMRIAEIAATNPDFATIWAHIEDFRNEANLWKKVAEYTFETFQISNRPKGDLILRRKGAAGNRDPLRCVRPWKS